MREALLYEKLADARVRCFLCAHGCTIAPDAFGLCGVRQNIGGVLYTHVYGKVIAEHVDPIEKKPLYHFLPGMTSYSIATMGCNFRCDFCQNWQISQARASDEVSSHRRDGVTTAPESIVEAAVNAGCKSISFTYTEPTIYFEYALDVARLARARGLKTVFVTNGFMTRAMLDMAKPYLDAANVDLKAFSERFYHSHCKARLAPVLDSIRAMRELGIWIEITTLVIPGENDAEEELRAAAGFIAAVGKEVPWHISRFFPQYEFLDRPPTPAATLSRAERLGREAGLQHVYLGNVAGDSDTRCPKCQSVLVRRRGYDVGAVAVRNGACSGCGTKIAGVWE